MRGSTLRRNVSTYSEQESFISNYQNNGVIGIIIYLLFVAFAAAEVLTTAILIPLQAEDSRFGLERGLLTLGLA
jgi:hypothetical protein